MLRGRQDFRAFTALNGPPNEDTVRDLRRLELTRRGKHVRITAEADGFLYKMVRSIVGALVKVGEGKMTAEELGGLLAGKKRVALVETAPSKGLFLWRVDY